MRTETATGGLVGEATSTKRALGMMLLPTALLTAIIVLFVALRGGSATEAEIRAVLPYMIALNHTIVFCVLLSFLRREGRSLRDIGWRIPAGPGIVAGQIAVGIVAGVHLYVFKELVFDSLQALMAGNQPTFTSLFRFGFDPAELPLLVVASTFVFVEESVYRGYGLPPLLERWRAWAALLVMAGLFGLLHWGNGPVAILYTGALGLAFAGLFLYLRSLWAATAAHAIYNALVILT